MYNHFKLLFPIILLATLSIAIHDINKEMTKNNTFQASAIPLLSYALAQEDEDEEAEEAEEEVTGEEASPATPTPTQGTTSFTISRTMEGNASMLSANLPLIKRIIVSDISDIEVLAPINVNETLRTNAQIIDEIDSTNQSVSRSATIKSVVSAELQQAISVLVADRNNENIRFVVDNQVQCIPALAPGNGAPSATNNPSCQFTISIHQ
jgi:hypothetical protein